MKKLWSLAPVLFLCCLTNACTDPDYTEIRFQEFPKQYEQFHRYPWEMLVLDEFSKAFEKILDDFPKKNYLDDFIQQLSVVSSGNRFVSTKQGSFIFITGCKPHFCMTSEISVLYDPRKEKAWAYISGEDIHSTSDFNIWLGQPDKRTKRLLEKLIDMNRPW